MPDPKDPRKEEEVFLDLDRDEDSGEEPATEPSAKRAGTPAEPQPAAAAPSDAASLGEQLRKLEADKQDLLQTLIRRQADFENYRKRVERERHEEGRRGVGRLIEELLPVLDAFERALKAHDDPAYEEYRKGLELIFRQLWDTLARHGLERIAAEGKRFDPYVHHAIERVETTEHEEGAILEVLQPGYQFHGRVLRPAGVRVAVHPTPKATEPGARRQAN